MTREEFEDLVAEGIEAIPEQFKKRIKNVAFLVEDEPSAEVREQEGLKGDETLFGYYHGIPMTERGSDYGVGETLPDTISIYQKPHEEEAGESKERLRVIVFDTIWHEVGHLLGLDEHEVRRRERERGTH